MNAATAHDEARPPAYRVACLLHWIGHPESGWRRGPGRGVALAEATVGELRAVVAVFDESVGPRTDPYRDAETRRHVVGELERREVAP